MRWSRARRVLIAACVATACIPDEPGVPSGAEPLELRGFPDEIVAEQLTGFTTQQRMVIRDVENWQEFWDILYATTSEKPPLPAVDFSQEMVVAATMGPHNTSGHSIHIDAVHAKGEDIWIEVRSRNPSLTCPRIPLQTSPATAVRVDRRSGGVSRIERGETVACE